MGNPAERTLPAIATLNCFQQPGEWFRANLHTHTTLSDGDTDLAGRCRQYREAGYHVLAVTDHERTSQTDGLSGEGFLVIGGMETHPPDPAGGLYHLVCLNVPHGFSLAGIDDANERIRRVREAGGEVIIAHPYWCGHTLADLLPLDGAVAVEVYNATCSKIGKAFSSVHWDDLLAAGRMLPAVAVDDVHRGRDIFMGWTWLKMQELTVESVLQALRSGCFYASCGPRIRDFQVTDGVARLRCSPVVEVHFIGRNAAGRSFYADAGEPFTEVEAPVNPGMRYVRCEVVDAAGNRAWTNPVILGGEVPPA